jgi:DNA-binding XRE family transcriptional regulator
MKLETAIEILENHVMGWRNQPKNDYYYVPENIYNAMEVVLAQVKKSIKLKTKKEIAMQIRNIRMANNFTQVYVANQIGISQPEYSKLENAHRKKPNLEVLGKLCQLFEVPMTEFLQ